MWDFDDDYRDLPLGQLQKSIKKPLTFGQIMLNTVLTIIVLFIAMYFASAFFIRGLTPENQIKLEESIDSALNIESYPLNSSEYSRVQNIKNKLYSMDSKFPKQAKLNVRIIRSNKLKVYCFYDGNIYITSELYRYLYNNEAMTFVIAHQMSHYKNKDHLMKLSKNISAIREIVFRGTGKIPVSLDSKKISLSDVKYSKVDEIRADKYAASALEKIFNSKRGGIVVLKALEKNAKSDKDMSDSDIEERIMRLGGAKSSGKAKTTKKKK